MSDLVLLTGGTGFVGRVMIRMLTARGYPLRVLLRPRKHMPCLPDPDVQSVITSLDDERGVRSALAGVKTIVHLASAEGERRWRNLLAVDVEGTRMLLAQARMAGVQRVMYLSHVGADRGSAFPFLQAKGIAEQAILTSGIPALILRTSILYGAGDAFTNVIAMMARTIPVVFPIPRFDAQMQPTWVEDLVACVDYCLAENMYFGETLALGGPEHLTFQQIVETILDALRLPRIIAPVWPPVMRLGASMMDTVFPHSPLTPFWLDYLSVNRTCEATSMARLFGLKASRLCERLEYLRNIGGLGQMWRFLRKGDSVFQRSTRIVRE